MKSLNKWYANPCDSKHRDAAMKMNPGERFSEHLAAAILTDPCPQERICEECGKLGGTERFETQDAQECSAPPRRVSLGSICNPCWIDIQFAEMDADEPGRV